MAIAVAGLLGAMSAPVATATTTKIAVTNTGAPSQLVEPGTWTETGTVQHVRDMVLREDGNWDSVYAIGPTYNTINWDLNLLTGSGAIWGTGIHYVTAVPGAEWHCSFRMPFKDFSYAGKGVCQGTGPLHGWQWRVDLTASPDGTTAVGYIFQPGS